MTAVATPRLGVAAGSAAAQEWPVATVSRSPAASVRPLRGAGARSCAWPLCGVLFVPRATGGKPQKYHAPHCRELAKAAARAVCPHCGGSLRRTALPATATDDPEPRNTSAVRRVALRRLR